MNLTYKVIADYPDSPFKIGDVIEWDTIVYGMNEPQCFVRNPEKYPKIFEPIDDIRVPKTYKDCLPKADYLDNYKYLDEE